MLNYNIMLTLISCFFSISNVRYIKKIMLIYCLHINSIPILFCKVCIMHLNTPLPPGR